MRARGRFRFALGVVLLIVARPASGQLPSPSTAALGMGENFTAAARGFASVSWNPALLGIHTNDGASLTLLTGRGLNGIGPVTLSDLSDYADALVPVGVKQDWLAQIVESGSQRGTGGIDATWAAMHIGRFGFQVSSSVRALMDVSPGVAQLVLFGNVDESGNAAPIDFAGSAVDVAAYSTVAASIAQPITLELGASRLSFGVTGKYTVGHVLARGDESQGSADPDYSMELRFPLVHTSLNGDSIEFNSGSGFGIDAGVALHSGSWTVGASVQNITNTFEWDASKLRYRPLRIVAENGSITTETEARSFDEAPADVQQTIEELTFGRGYAAGIAYEPNTRLKLAADARVADDDGMVTGPTRHIGAGAQFKLTNWLPLRAGGALIELGEGNGGHQFAGGLGINLGGWNLAASAMLRRTDRYGSDTVLMATLFGTGLP